MYRHPRTFPLDPETGQTTGERSHVAFAVAAMRVVVEVDVAVGSEAHTAVVLDSEVVVSYSKEGREKEIEREREY